MSLRHSVTSVRGRTFPVSLSFSPGPDQGHSLTRSDRRNPLEPKTRYSRQWAQDGKSSSLTLSQYYGLMCLSICTCFLLCKGENLSFSLVYNLDRMECKACGICISTCAHGTAVATDNGHECHSKMPSEMSLFIAVPPKHRHQFINC